MTIERIDLLFIYISQYNKLFHSTTSHNTSNLSAPPVPPYSVSPRHTHTQWTDLYSRTDMYKWTDRTYCTVYLHREQGIEIPSQVVTGDTIYCQVWTDVRGAVHLWSDRPWQRWCQVWTGPLTTPPPQPDQMQPIWTPGGEWHHVPYFTPSLTQVPLLPSDLDAPAPIWVPVGVLVLKWGVVMRLVQSDSILSAENCSLSFLENPPFAKHQSAISTEWIGGGTLIGWWHVMPKPHPWLIKGRVGKLLLKHFLTYFFKFSSCPENHHYIKMSGKKKGQPGPSPVGL